MSLKSGRLKKARDGGINRKKWAGKRDLRTLLWTLWQAEFWSFDDVVLLVGEAALIKAGFHEHYNTGTLYLCCSEMGYTAG